MFGCEPPSRSRICVSGCITIGGRVAGPLDFDLLDEDDPFEIDEQAAHLFKHSSLGIDDIYDVWRSNPLFYPAKPPATGSW